MLLRGLAAIGFGILVIAKPQISLQVLVYLFGLYVLVEGILGVALAIQGRDLTAPALLFYIALWAIATGVLEIATAIRLREVLGNEWLLILAGIVSVAFGA